MKQEERNKATEDMERWKTSAKETSEVKNKDKQPSEEDASRKSVSEEDASRKSVSEEDASRKSVPLWEEEELGGLFTGILAHLACSFQRGGVFYLFA